MQSMKYKEDAREKYKNVFEEASIRLPGFYTNDDFWFFNSIPAPLTRDKAFEKVNKVKKKHKH